MIVVYKWSFLLYFEKSLEGDGTKISSKGPSVFDLHLYCWSIISNMHRSTILWTYKGFNFCWNWQCVFWFIVWFTALQIPFKTGGDDAGRHECTWFGAVFWCCGAREFCWSRESACIKVSLSRFVYAATSPHVSICWLFSSFDICSRVITTVENANWSRVALVQLELKESKHI